MIHYYRHFKVIDSTPLQPCVYLYTYYRSFGRGCTSLHLSWTLGPCTTYGTLSAETTLQVSGSSIGI